MIQLAGAELLKRDVVTLPPFIERCGALAQPNHEGGQRAVTRMARLLALGAQELCQLGPPIHGRSIGGLTDGGHQRDSSRGRASETTWRPTLPVAPVPRTPSHQIPSIAAA